MHTVYIYIVPIRTVYVTVSCKVRASTRFRDGNKTAPLRSPAKKEAKAAESEVITCSLRPRLKRLETKPGGPSSTSVNQDTSHWKLNRLSLAPH